MWGIFFMVLKVMGLLLVCLLALIFVVLILPITIKLHYEKGQLQASAGTLGVMVQIFPRKQRKQKNEPEQKQDARKSAAVHRPTKKMQAKNTTATAAQNEKKLLLSGDALCQLVKTAGWLLCRILAGIQVHDVRIRLPIHGADAADTAIRYGKTNAWLYSTLGVLQNGLDIRVKELALVPDFNGEKQGTELFSCKITARLIIMLIAGLRAFIQLTKAGVL